MSKSYEFNFKPSPNHEIYKTWLSRLGLKIHHEQDLIRRGLSKKHIHEAGYATKLPNSVHDAQVALYTTDSAHNLDDVPGFYKNDKGQRAQIGGSGIAIPIRDINGQITSILIRNDNPKEESGRKQNKYFYFSSKNKLKGGNAKASVHHPVVKGLPKSACETGELRVTEGALKADVTTALGKVYTVGLPGLKVIGDIKNTIKTLDIDTLTIALDAEYQNSDVLKCCADLIQTAEEAEIDFKVQLWEPEYGKGIDDVLAAGHEDKIRYASDEEIQAIKERAHKKNPFNGEWIYAVLQKKFYHKKTYDSVDKSQFADLFGIIKIQDVNKILADGFEQVFDTIYEPGQELIIQKDGKSFLNIWRDPNIESIPGDVGPLLNHAEYLFPSSTDTGLLYQSILLDTLAFYVQNPGVKMRWMLLLQGEAEGTGKSFWAEVMKMVLGPYNVVSPSMETLHDKFTGWQKNCQLVIIEEMMARGRQELMNKLKTMITADTSNLRQMQREEYEQANHYNFFCFTNYPDAIIINDHDRRYGIIKTDAAPESEQHYVDLFGWLKAPGTVNHIKHYLLSRDLTKFNPYRAPMTPAKQDVIEVSRNPLDEWVKNGISDRCWPFNRQIVVVRHLKEKKPCPAGFERYSDHKWVQALKKCGAKKYSDQVKLSDGSRVTMWLIGDQKNILERLPAKDLAALYQKDPLEYTFDEGHDLMDSEDQKISSFQGRVKKAENGPVIYRHDNSANPIRDDEPM